jgi:1-acyl-sn-glycerol-3-phosphate acyltransferase
MRWLPRSVAAIVAAIARLVIVGWCRWSVARHLALTVHGREHVPRTGPVVVVSRHYHHFFDGAVFLTRLPRRVHILVGLDWVATGAQRGMMEWACRTVRWPIILRGEERALLARGEDVAGTSAYRQEERARYLRRATREVIALLREGRVLVIFPEGYPNVDPTYTPKTSPDAFLPFRPGFLKLVALAQRDGHTHVALLPAGFSYRPGARWHVTLRLGAPLWLRPSDDPDTVLSTIAAQVRALSRADDPGDATPPG